MSTESDPHPAPRPAAGATKGEHGPVRKPSGSTRDPQSTALASTPPAVESPLRRFTRSLPTLVVIAALAGLGYFGHHHGWRMPRFSELTGRSEAATVAWCGEHNVPEEICVACNAELMPKGALHGWCREHGVAECLLEHPELAQLREPAGILPEDLERAGRALATRERAKNDPLCKLHLRRIQFSSGDAADKAGIDIGLVDRGPVEESVPAIGEIRYDPTLVTRVATRAAGTVWRVDKNVGDPVREGELLALVDAVVVGQAKAALLQAAAQLHLHDQAVQRLAGLANVVEGRRLQEAEAAREEAEAAVRKEVQILANLGLPITLDDVRGKKGSDVAARLHTLGLPPAEPGQQRTTANLIPLLAPRDGAVVERDVVAGEVVDTSQTLFTIVDNRRMWLLLDVAIEDMPYVRIGRRVVFRPDGATRDHSGEITWISTRIDPQTRTVQVRAELPNDDGDLLDESFGAGRIILREEENAILVPNAAIHWEGCCHVAFVRDRNFLADDSYKVFHTRMVRPGVTSGDFTEVLAGLLPGEVVVTKGSGMLRAELLKGNLGAG